MFFESSWSQEGVLSIEQDSLMSKLLSLKINANNQVYEDQYYNIQLFYGSYDKALNVKKHITNKFPKEKINLSFETPNYKVQMGPYRDKIKSISLLKKIKKIYPAAFLIEPKAIL